MLQYIAKIHLQVHAQSILLQTAQIELYIVITLVGAMGDLPG